MKRRKLVVSVPAYNEEETIGKVVSEVRAAIKHLHYASVVSHPRNYGLASTFRTEVENCIRLGTNYIVHFDADGRYVASDFPKLVKELESSADLVLGSRFKGSIESCLY